MQGNHQYFRTIKSQRWKIEVKHDMASMNRVILRKNVIADVLTRLKNGSVEKKGLIEALKRNKLQLKAKKWLFVTPDKTFYGAIGLFWWPFDVFLPLYLWLSSQKTGSCFGTKRTSMRFARISCFFKLIYSDHGSSETWWDKLLHLN